MPVDDGVGSDKDVFPQQNVAAVGVQNAALAQLALGADHNPSLLRAEARSQVQMLAELTWA